MQCIVLLIILLCFQVELDWFTEPAAVIQLCRSRWPYVGACRATQKSPRPLPTLGDIRMACYRTSGSAVLAEQRHRGSLSCGIPCGAAVAHRRVAISAPWQLSEIELQWQSDQASRICCWYGAGRGDIERLWLYELKIKIPAICSWRLFACRNISMF